MNIEIKSFKELTNAELYKLLSFRTQIFVVEQECAYQEVDNQDQPSLHVIGKQNNVLVACARICPPGTVYQEPSIGRVAVLQSERQSGFGRKIFQRALDETLRLYPNQKIKIQAQVYLEEFYKSFGFITISDPYPDVGVMHVDMILPPQPNG